ncbi:Mycophenolic acid acyl-glucuronide esterase, mitochondrial [Halocaridina rubra]|uniref:Palmitoyl-protein thioesterase ABHD10, mitochondrial n=1 Tax=Halocaridina rubra TaxID=373956 RepID=A0AAN8X1U9_HALRR
MPSPLQLRIAQEVFKIRSLYSKCNPVMAASNKFHASAADPPTEFLEVKDEQTGSIRKIAYMKSPGPRSPGIIYIPGFMSHKSGIKSATLSQFCLKYGFPYVRYDPSGLGESEGVHVTETLFSMWVQDAKEILLRATDGPQLVVGSSMGGWISCLLAEKHPEKIEKILFIAPGINFHVRYDKVLRSQLDAKSLQKYEEGGVVSLYNPDYGSFPLRRAQFDDMAKLALSLEPGAVNVNCPIRILHGVQDKDVPFKESLELLKALKSTDVRLIYLKDGDHRLASEEKLEVMFDTILDMTSSKSSSNV